VAGGVGAVVSVGIGVGVSVAVGSGVGVGVVVGVDVGGAVDTISATMASLGVALGELGVDGGSIVARPECGSDGKANATIKATADVTRTAAPASAHLGGRAVSSMAGRTSASSMSSMSATCSPFQPRRASSSETA